MLLGKNLIDGDWVGSEETLASPDLEGFEFAQASLDQIDVACTAARRDFRAYAGISRTDRAAFLRACADEIDALVRDLSGVVSDTTDSGEDE